MKRQSTARREIFRSNIVLSRGCDAHRRGVSGPSFFLLPRRSSLVFSVLYYSPRCPPAVPPPSPQDPGHTIFGPSESAARWRTCVPLSPPPSVSPLHSQISNVKVPRCRRQWVNEKSRDKNFKRYKPRAIDRGGTVRWSRFKDAILFLQLFQTSVSR